MIIWRPANVVIVVLKTRRTNVTYVMIECATTIDVSAGYAAKTYAVMTAHYASYVNKTCVNLIQQKSILTIMTQKQYAADARNNHSLIFNQ